jgi:hypothetical protein
MPTTIRTLQSAALNLVKKYFNDKYDKGGHSYKEHLYAVAQAIDDEKKKKVSDRNSTLAIFYDKCWIVGILHDILEDTECTVEELKINGFDDEIIEAIQSVTRKKDEQYYFDFIERVSKNDIGRIVKIYDLENNMDIRRLNEFGEYEQKRLRKYFYSWKFLKGEINALSANNIIHPDRKWR